MVHKQFRVKFYSRCKLKLNQDEAVDDCSVIGRDWHHVSAREF